MKKEVRKSLTTRRPRILIIARTRQLSLLLLLIFIINYDQFGDVRLHSTIQHHDNSHRRCPIRLGMKIIIFWILLAIAPKRNVHHVFPSPRLCQGCLHRGCHRTWRASFRQLYLEIRPVSHIAALHSPVESDMCSVNPLTSSMPVSFILHPSSQLLLRLTPKYFPLLGFLTLTSSLALLTRVSPWLLSPL